jgi:hydroxymethylglutaryl-CoA lyase
MGFGNPYGDPWDVEIGRLDWKVIENGRENLSLSDTVGNSTPDVISYLFSIWFHNTPKLSLELIPRQINGSRK